MLKKTITYESYDGETLTEDFYFNLNKAELVELEVSEKDGFAESLQKIVADNNGELIIATFRKIILMAYGVKSEDGKRFIKSQELRDAFAQTEAYSNLFVELATDAGEAAKFINGIIPREFSEKLDQLQLPEPGTDEPEPGTDEPDLSQMSKEELIKHFQTQGP